MDLTNMIPGGAGEEQAVEQRLSKEEYAAMKKQQREEVWAEVDAQAQAVFQNGESLKGFLDFMAQCNTQKTPNLLLIYGQNPQATVVKSYDYWKAENRSPKSGVHGYTYMVSTEYEKDGEMRTGYTISKGFDISQMSGKPLEERPQRSMEELIHAVLKDQPVRMQIADNLPEGIQAQYIPKQRTVYVRNGMDENTTFHAVNRELACAALDQHNGNYVRKKVNAQAYCAAYVIGKRYGAEVSGFQFGKVAEMQANGQKDPQELRGFLNDVRQAAYTIRNHMERNFGEQEQTFTKDDFSFEEPPKQAPNYLKTDNIMKNMFTVALKDELADQSQMGKVRPATEAMLQKVRSYELSEKRLPITIEEQRELRNALNRLRDKYLAMGRYSDGIDSVILKVMKPNTSRRFFW